MSVHLLRQGARTCRLTPFRLASSRRLYVSQAVHARHDPSPDASTSQPTPNEPPRPETDAAIVPDNTPSSKPEPAPRKRSHKKKVAQSTPEETNAAPSKEPTRVDLYLAALTVSGVEPQLPDLERCRPKSHPDPLTAGYPKAYNGLVDTLCRSFSKEQLRLFIAKYGLDRSLHKKNRTKVEYAESIIEVQWKWPSLKAIEKDHRDRTEVVVESFPATPSQLFLILGRDGVDLLQLTMQFNVHISLRPKPLALRAEGVRSSINALGKRLAQIKKGVVEETFQLPTQTLVEPKLIQRISRLAGAYIENIGSAGLIRLCAKTAQDLESAKRLATRAITELHVAKNTPFLSYLPMGVPSLSQVPAVLFPHAYSLYPFLSPQHLPWYVSAAAAFRLRRVGEWLGNTSCENIAKTGGLAGDKGRVLNVNHEAVDLKEVLLRAPATEDVHRAGSQRSLKASLGHMLFASPSGDKRSALIPPLTGAYQFAKILEWMQNHNTNTTFVPSLPMTFVHKPPSHQRLVHRLVYRALPTSTDGNTNAPISPNPNDNVTMPTTYTMNLEVVLARPKDVDGASTEASSLSFTPRCWKATENELDLLLPDRPIDVRYKVLDTTEIPDADAPWDMREYISALQAFLTSKDKASERPHAPLTLHHRGITYVLQATANVRQNFESFDEGESDEAADSAVQVISESIMDLESNERVTRCEIICTDPTSPHGWHQFLEKCDVLSCDGYRPATSLPTGGIEAETL